VEDADSIWALPGNLHWLLRRPKLLARPVPHPGRLSLHWRRPPEPHNIPLQFLSETGIVGFLLFLAAAVAACKGRSDYKRTEYSSSGYRLQAARRMTDVRVYEMIVPTQWCRALRPADGGRRIGIDTVLRQSVTAAYGHRGCDRALHARRPLIHGESSREAEGDLSRRQLAILRYLRRLHGVAVD